MRGGKREGSGRKSKFGSPMNNLTMRVPDSERENIRKLVSKYLDKLLNSCK